MIYHRMFDKSNTLDATNRVETVYPSGARVHPVFSGFRVAKSIFLCSVMLTIIYEKKV